MAYLKANFVRLWKLTTAYIDSIDMATEVALLATERSVDSGNAADATYYDERNPAFTVVRGEARPEHEERLPLISVDVLSWPHDTARKSADNRCQYWAMDFLVTISTVGQTTDDAEVRCMDATSVLINKWTGPGSRLGGVNRDDTAFDYSVLQSGGWSTQARGDQFVTSGQLVLTVGTRVKYSA